MHANSAGRDDIHGLETYCLHHKLFTNIQDTASKQFRSSLQQLYQQSYRLAQQVHNGILHTSNKYRPIHDRKVKQAVTQLLLGTNTPGILVELGFLTHPQEAQRLATKTYQQQLAQGIVNGISAYFKS